MQAKRGIAWLVTALSLLALICAPAPGLAAGDSASSFSSILPIAAQSSLERLTDGVSGLVEQLGFDDLLDGSRIVDGFIPYGLRPAWERFLSLAPFLLLAVFWFGGRFVSGPVNAAVDLVRHLSRAIILG